MQEEFRKNNKDGSSSKHDDEEDYALAAKVRKGKVNKSHSKSEAKGKKLDLSKVNCFHCHNMGISPLIGHKKRRTRRLLELQLVRPLPQNLNLISP